MTDQINELRDYCERLDEYQGEIDIVALIERESQGDVLDDHHGPITEQKLAEPVQGSVDDLVVDYLQQRPDGSDASAERNRWSGVVGAVAAMVLAVVGVVVVADGNSGDVVSDPASTASADAPAAVGVDVAPVVDADVAAAWSVFLRSQPEPEPEPDVFVDDDRPGCEIPSGWAQVCDAASFDGAAMYAVTAGGPGLVAVGGEDNEYYTREGYTPLWGEYPTRSDWDGWIGFADAVVLTSPDGLSWSRVSHDEAVFGGDGSQHMFGVTAGGPGLVAVGRDGPAVDGEGHAAVWTSPDGLTWSRVPHDEAVFGGPGEQRMVDVAVGGPGLVAVGFDRTTDNTEGDAAVWTSPDGLTWSRIPHDEAVFGGDSRQMMLSVTVGGPGLVAVGSDGNDDSDFDRRIDESAADAAVWTSPDGLTWSRVPHDEAVFGGPGAQRMVDVAVGGPGLVAVGSVTETLDGFYELSDAAVWTSLDGFTWSRVPDDEAVFSTSGALGDKDEAMLSVTAGGPGVVAVGFDSVDDCGWDSAVWTSPDGLTWSRVPDERNCVPFGPYDRMLSVTVGPSGLVAVGEEHSPGGAAAVWND